VFSIERIPALLQQARENIQRAGVNNVSLLLGDGTIGWREYSPYDAILVSAGAPSIPQPLLDQLAEGGRLLIPIGDREEQKLIVAERKNGQVEAHDIAAVRFVPLLGSHGWGGGEGT
jgi:protein-L-isoaspartate(D-aspartate) O-methyltransferase